MESKNGILKNDFMARDSSITKLDDTGQYMAQNPNKT